MECHALGSSIENQSTQVPLVLSGCKLSFRKESSFSWWKIVARERSHPSHLPERGGGSEAEKPRVPRSNPTETTFMWCLCIMQRHEIQVTAGLVSKNIKIKKSSDPFVFPEVTEKNQLSFHDLIRVTYDPFVLHRARPFTDLPNFHLLSYKWLAELFAATDKSGQNTW